MDIEFVAGTLLIEADGDRVTLSPAGVGELRQWLHDNYRRFRAS